MSLSVYLQDKSVLSVLPGGNHERLCEAICLRGVQWYAENPGEQAVIHANLAAFGMDCDKELVARIQHHILLHYYEKLLPLCGSIPSYHAFLASHVDTKDAFQQLDTIQKSGRAILAAISHFGGVELVTPVLASRKCPVSTAIRFTTEEFSRRAHTQAASMSGSGLYGKISLVELGKPGTTAALDMAATLRRGETLITVFDEKTDYSIPVSLMGRSVWGGAGLDRLILFARTPLAVVAPFIVRLPGNRYRLELEELPLDGKGTVQAMYTALERILKHHPDQWYFLHEEIPFC